MRRTILFGLVGLIAVGCDDATRMTRQPRVAAPAANVAAPNNAIDLGYGPNLFYYLRHDAGGFSTFGTISTSGAITDRFGVGLNFAALTFAAPDVGYGPNLFYYPRRDAGGFSTFGTISTSGAITDRFGLGLNFAALTFAAPDVGYGPSLFYFFRHDAGGFSTFGTISTSGAITDRFGVGLNFDALTFTARDVGYGRNLFYYVRHDATGFSTFGTISTVGAITDRFGVGLNFDALAFASADVGYGSDLFYYLRHDGGGFSTFGTISTSGAITDRFGVGFQFNALTFPEVFETPPIQVTIKIKPGGSFPVSINPESKGVIPVAILTTPTFDATTVDPPSVRFGVTGTQATALRSGLEDVDGDGRLDMILHFNMQATGIHCPDASASLTGKTLGGQTIQGSEAFQTVGC
jgi:hypothetical protein